MHNENTLANKIKNKHKPKVVILTGAGISAESGIKTFRDNNGLWENHSIKEVATPEGFAANPELVYQFYNERRAQLLSGDVQANVAHFALAELENTLESNLVIVSQNVDNLHEAAGNKNVIHMHGSLVSAKCCRSAKSVATYHDINAQSRCNCCKPPSPMRPDIVWFGEVPYHMELIEKHLYNADIFVSIGTSGNVYPAAGFAAFANECGAYTIELNLEPSEGASQFNEQHCGLASKLVPEFVRRVKGLLSV